MKITKGLLVAFLGALAIAHGLISLYHNKGLAGGDYFSSGIILMSDGKIIQSSKRLYADGADLYSYDQVGIDSYEFNFFREYSIKGYISYVRKNFEVKKNQTKKFTDRDISFNLSYVSSPGSRLTLSEIPTPYRAKCIYVYELSSVYCYSAKRLDAP